MPFMGPYLVPSRPLGGIGPRLVNRTTHYPTLGLQRPTVRHFLGFVLHSAVRYPIAP